LNALTVLSLPGAIILVALLRKAQSRLELSRAKHWSLAGHSRMARRIAKLVPFYEYAEDEIFACDSAPAEIAEKRRGAFLRLAGVLSQRETRSCAATARLENSLSDLQFTSRYRVPFQFTGFVREHFKAASVITSSSGAQLTDLDGNTFYDLSGSYGVNAFGYDFYKECIARGSKRVADLGPVLGGYHPVVEYNLRRLKEISGLDEVSFHMSGTEAVMQAVRLARYHTKRGFLVRFCGAYHGWWGDVQPGIGSPDDARQTYTLRDMNEASLRVLRKRSDIACVLVNPLQALHPNSNAPSDSALIDSSRRAQFDRGAYTAWLQKLRRECTEHNIVLVFDEVFCGFRLAVGGAQEYFGVRADLVTYGKTVGGGLPVGVLCGRREFMKRYRDERPADICFARGTFNCHPYVMGAMNEFLRRLESAQFRVLYAGLDLLWNDRARLLNERLRTAGLPVRVCNLSSIWTVIYLQPSRYNWMFQYYLRAEGLALSWVGTGRFIFSVDYSHADFVQVAARVVAAARTMQSDGWWWSGAELTNRSIRHRVLKEMIRTLLRPAVVQATRRAADAAVLCDKA
jgi:glutamate-1-semialdehyde 2,1-aminomutase